MAKKPRRAKESAPPTWRIEEVATQRGEKVVRKFITELGKEDQEESAALLKTLAEKGNELGMPDSKALGGGLFELRGRQVRIFYCFRPGGGIVLLDGMVKQRQDIPDDVLKRLRRLVERID